MVRKLGGPNISAEGETKPIQSIVFYQSCRQVLKYEGADTFRIFRGPLFHKPVTGKELFFAVSYSKPALVKYCLLTSLSVFLSETQNRGVRLNPQQSLCLLMLANLYFQTLLRSCVTLDCLSSQFCRKKQLFLEIITACLRNGHIYEKEGLLDTFTKRNNG